MRVDKILIGKQTSKHLYHLKQDIEPEDLLNVIRFLAHKGKELEYLYSKDKIYYTKSDLIMKQEFDYVYENTNENLDYWFDRYTREDLVNRVGIAIKIISSTTKTEIVKRIREDRNLLFRFFKKDFIERCCSKWHDFKRYKIFIPAVSDETKYLVFALSSRDVFLSGKGYLQYWHLGDTYDHVELNKNFKTEIAKDGLAINLKDDDEIVLKKLHAFLTKYDNQTEIGLRCVWQSIGNSDLDIEKVKSVRYPLGLDALTEHFGERRGSKFLTFSEGLRKRKYPEVVKDYLGKKFLIASNNYDIYCGLEHDQEFFEKIAWYLKIEYINDKRIICEVMEEETQETITALWEIMSERQYTGEFYFIEI